MEHLFLMFLDHTQWRSTVGRTPLDKWSARRRDLYLTTQDTHNRQISMPPVGFEPKISAGERAFKQFKWPRPQCVKTNDHLTTHLWKKENIAPCQCRQIKSSQKVGFGHNFDIHWLMALVDFSVSIHAQSIKYLTLCFVHDMHKSGHLFVLLKQM